MKPPRIHDKIGNFTTLPNSFIERFKGSVKAKWLFTCLRYHTNSKTDDAFPSYDTLEQTTGLTRRDIAKSIRELIEAGWLERRRRFGDSTIYTTCIPASISLNGVTNESGVISNTVDTVISNTVETIISNNGVHTNKTNKQNELTKREVTPAKLETPAATPPPPNIPRKHVTNTTHHASTLAALQSFETSTRDIMDAYTEAFKRSPNWNNKTNSDALRSLKNKAACREKILAAAKFWKSEMTWCKYPSPSQLLEYWDAAMAFNAPAPVQSVPAIRAAREITGILYDPNAPRQL